MHPSPRSRRSSRQGADLRLALVPFSCLLFGLATPPAAAAQEVRLPLAEYQQLYDRAHPQPPAPPPAPVPLAFERARLQVTVDEASARVRQELTLVLQGDSWQRLPLPATGALVRAEFGDLDGLLEAEPQPTLRLRGSGRHTVVVESALPVERNDRATRRTWDLTLQLPAGVLAQAEGWQDARSGHPWAVTAQAVLQALEQLQSPPPGLRRRLLALAESLLAAPELHLRGVPAERILEGLVARHLTAPTAPPPASPVPWAERATARACRSLQLTTRRALRLDRSGTSLKPPGRAPNACIAAHVHCKAWMTVLWCSNSVAVQAQRPLSSATL